MGFDVILDSEQFYIQKRVISFFYDYYHKNKPCKRDNYQDFVKTKTATEESNTGEMLYLVCKICDEGSVRNVAVFHILKGIFLSG